MQGLAGMSMSFSSAWVRPRCPSCRFISKNDTSTKCCPACGASVRLRDYPDVPATRLLRMIRYFYDVASRVHEDELSSTVMRISQLLKRPLSEKEVYKGWIEINRTFSKSGSYSGTNDRIKRFFRCDESKAESIFQIYITPESFAPELTVVPILVVTLIEALLNDLLVDLEVKYQQDSILEAREKIRKLQSFDERYDLFESFTGKNFPKIVQQISKPFWDRWKNVRRKRNFFVHGNPYALGWKVCESAFELTLDSIDLFAELNNQFVVQE